MYIFRPFEETKNNLTSHESYLVHLIVKYIQTCKVKKSEEKNPHKHISNYNN